MIVIEKIKIIIKEKMIINRFIESFVKKKPALLNKLEKFTPLDILKLFFVWYNLWISPKKDFFDILEITSLIILEKTSWNILKRTKLKVVIFNKGNKLFFDPVMGMSSMNRMLIDLSHAQLSYMQIGHMNKAEEF